MRDVIEMQMTEIRQALQGDEASVVSAEREEHSPSQSQPRSRDISPSPVHSRSREGDRHKDNHRGHSGTQ